MPDNLFISYRREDTQYLAGRLFDRLESRYGEGRVFMDVDGIDPGLDFGEAIEEQLDQCNVLIALIGPNWLNIADARGRRRLDNPDDLVRFEIATGLRRGIPVIPVLADKTLLPDRDELPDDLIALARRQSVRLAHSSFNADVAGLLDGLDRLFARQVRERERWAEQAAPVSPPEAEEPERSSVSATPRLDALLAQVESSDADVWEPSLSLDDLRSKRFRMSRKSGYEVLEVDQFVDQLDTTYARMLDDLARHRGRDVIRGLEPGMVTLAEIRDKRFRMARRAGYEVLEVDQFLDEMVAAFHEVLTELGRPPGPMVRA